MEVSGSPRYSALRTSKLLGLDQPFFKEPEFTNKKAENIEILGTHQGPFSGLKLKSSFLFHTDAAEITYL